MLNHTNDRIFCFEFCPTGGLLATGGDEGKVMICMLVSCYCDVCTKLHLQPRELWPGAKYLVTDVSLFCLVAFFIHSRPGHYMTNKMMHMITNALVQNIKCQLI